MRDSAEIIALVRGSPTAAELVQSLFDEFTAADFTHIREALIENESAEDVTAALGDSGEVLTGPVHPGIEIDFRAFEGLLN